MPNPLDDSIQFLKHVGPARVGDFARLGVRTVRDLVWTFPRDMSDRSSFFRIADAPEDTPVTIAATAVSVTERAPRRNFRARGAARSLTLTTAEFDDGSGMFLEVTWFNQPWLKDRLPLARLLLHGKAKRAGKKLRMEHPLYEFLPDAPDAPPDAPETLNFGRIVPIYPCTGALSQTVWRKAMAHALDTRLPDIEDPLPAALRERKGFPDLAWAIRQMHFPESREDWLRARGRLAWEECLYLQLSVLAARRHALHDLPGRRFAITAELDARIRRLFPYKFTAAQDRAVREIAMDMRSPLPMQRLLQGDVGSGKTAVAAWALLAAVANRAQACLMAPTSLLARQHYDTFSRLLAESDRSKVRVGLLVGGMPAAERRVTLERLANGTLDIVSATHSAVSDDVVFRDLGLAVIDEQHKFGVHQRLRLARKGVRPDTLVMTATPIPRSLALSVYGDLDLSTIDELPPGRKPVRTLRASPSGKHPRPAEAWALLRDELKRGRQGFVVCPLVEESEDSDLRSAEEAFAELGATELKGFSLALLHGRMKRPEQQAIMERFREGRVDVLISTIVIEVGVDVPNATVMVVEHAERFGMAQLHQLRGRVGRGAEQGYFVMLSEPSGEEAEARLNALAASPDGFAVAEEDLRLRGPGDFTGTRQSGVSALRLVDLSKDVELLADARAEAGAILSADPELRAPEHLPLLRELVRLYGPAWDHAAGS